MNTLSGKAFDASRRFLEGTARPLELARYQHAFLDGSSEMVLNALGQYQNDDGGFGRSLEPDLRAPESSVLCTSIAFQILRALNASPENPLVSGGIRFLMVNLDREQYGWRIIPGTAEDSPRAPWWYQEGREEQFASFSLNPTAEILGYLFDYPAKVEHDVISAVSGRVLRALSDLAKIEMHDLLCCLRLFQTTTLPPEYRGQLFARIKVLMKDTIACDPEQWEGYSLRPLQVVHSPESPFMAGLEQDVAANLDYEIASQNADGSWAVTWSWDDTFPEEWASAKMEWSGVITLEKLLTLKRFGRIKGVA
jgi:hypothetical protein